MKDLMIMQQEAQQRGDAHALLEEAHKLKKIGIRQYGALKKHAMHHSPDHIAAMLELMEHMNFRDAHKAALSTVGV